MKFLNLKNKTKKDGVKTPTGIKIISVVYYLSAVLYLAIAVISLFFPDIIFKIPDFNEITNSSASIIIGVIFILLTIFSITVATGIRKLKSWARIAIIIFCSLNIIGGIFSVVEGSYLSLINLIFNLLIASYLIFSKKIRESFHSKPDNID
jgi:hypothetical protein